VELPVMFVTTWTVRYPLPISSTTVLDTVLRELPEPQHNAVNKHP
jgi:hypothetical protein